MRVGGGWKGGGGGTNPRIGACNVRVEVTLSSTDRHDQVKDVCVFRLHRVSLALHTNTSPCHPIIVRTRRIPLQNINIPFMTSLITSQSVCSFSYLWVVVGQLEADDGFDSELQNQFPEHFVRFLDGHLRSVERLSRTVALKYITTRE